jgi:lipoprotein-anchoring transpeptidase ErfK/SrfK
VAKRRTKTSRPRKARPGGNSSAGAWLSVLLLFAAGGAGAWYFLRAERAPSSKAAKPVQVAKPSVTVTRPAAEKPAKSPVAAKAVAPAVSKPVVVAPGRPTESATVQFRAPDVFPRPPSSWLEAQVALARRGYSCGSIDGVFGTQTAWAWHAFQAEAGLPETNWLDERTCAVLELEAPATTRVTVTAADLARLQPLSTTWFGKSEQTVLDYETLLELVAERARSHPKLVQKLNPDFDWEHPTVGAVLVVPAAARTTPRAKAASLHVQLAARILQARDGDGRLIAHFPVSIAKKVEKRPVGELHVVVVAPDPNYTFDPEVFPESAEARELGRKLVVPPGPNNPVGLAWIGLDRSGYGIHGTPNPEQVGRTESHGCFRLANWDALTLLDLVWNGLPVYVEP